MKKIFNGTQEARSHAAGMVARFWLKSAQEIISRGDKPASIKTCAAELARDEIDRDIYNFHRRWLDSSWIATDAISLVRQSLTIGNYPQILAQFADDLRIGKSPFDP